MKLYSGPLSMFGAKAEIAAREKGLDFELVMVPFDMKALYQPKHPEVLRINPKPQPALWPAEPRSRARARLLEHTSDEVYFPPIVRLMGLQAAPQDAAAIE